MGLYTPSKNPPARVKTMMFIDGTNLLVQMYKMLGIKQKMAYKPSPAALMLAMYLIEDGETWFRSLTQYKSEEDVFARKYWIGSYQGTEDDGFRLAQELRELFFEPILFKQINKGKEKGVDIALAKEMLVNAFQQNVERSYLVAGDADYITLVNEVKRYGQQVRGIFFEQYTSPRLKLVFDDFADICWQRKDWLKTYPSARAIKAAEPADNPDPSTIHGNGEGI
jgi:uncharacterized LabA/DUF88 family protein